MSDRALEVAMWHAGPDYLRLTMPPGGARGLDVDAYKLATMEIGRKSALGESDIKAWAMQGYYGQQYGRASWGIGHQGSMFQVTSGAAEDAVGMRLPWHNVPRLDIQVTVWYRDYIQVIAREAAERSHLARAGQGGRGWQVRHIDGFGKGDTCYLGSRTSDTFVRIYDKWRESGDDEYLHAWRYEVEFKGDAAAAIWAFEERSVPEPLWWASHVQAVLERRGLSLPLPVGPAFQAGRPKIDEVSEKERKLTWYRNQVAPSVQKLLASGVAVGEVLEALGIRDGTRQLDR